MAYRVNEASLTAVADSIRETNGGTQPLQFPEGFTGGIEEIRTMLAGIADGNITKMVIPDGVETICQFAFYGRKKLASVAIPDSVATIGNGAFFNCFELQIAELPPNLVTLEAQAFYQNWQSTISRIPATVKTIGNGAFYQNSRITSVTFEGTPTTLHAQAFQGCSNLETINCPWAEGEVANAPWGATNATINYNYSGG